MKINKDSIIVKIIFYNNIAIILTAIAVAFITTFITFQDMEADLIVTSREKISLLNKAKENYFSKIKEDLYEVSRKDREKNLVNIKEDKVLAQVLKTNLLQKNYLKYKNVDIAIANEDGEILGNAGSDKIFKIKDKDISNGRFRKRNSLIRVDGQIYSKIVVPYKNNEKVKEYIVAVIPLNDKFLQYLKNFIELNDKDKIFSVSGDKYLDGDFISEKAKEHISKNSFKVLTTGKYKYFYKKEKIAKTPYYVATLSLRDAEDNYIGNFGVAISREAVFKTKMIVGVFITFLVLLLVAVFTTVFTKVLTKLLSPLKDITEASERISSGKYDVPLDFKGNGEIQVLANSIKKMLCKLEENQKKVEIKNERLEENLDKIITVEQLLLGIQIEDDVTSVVRKLMTALTSEMGLGFARTMFFRYSREHNVLQGECTQVNTHMAESKKDLLRENKPGFDFQMKELKDVVPLIKIPFEEDNIISHSLKNKEIIYFNDKGYKYDLGNDLFKSLGLNNFLIFPVYNVDYYSGVIICDYYTKCKNITKSDKELLTLLLMNVSVKLKNKINEADKIDVERNTTISKISERFFTTRDSTLNNLIKVLEDTKNSENLNLSEIIKILEEKINRIKETNKILLEYSTVGKLNYGRVNIEHLMPEVIHEFKHKYLKDNQDVVLSSFIGYTGDVYGDNDRLGKVFMELLKNAFDAVVAGNKKSKKINVIVTRDKYANKVKINIQDNGVGMSEEMLATIEEPFISYKENAPGLGVPLAVKVIKECHGVIKFKSKENIGTKVKITLNLYNEKLIKKKNKK